MDLSGQEDMNVRLLDFIAIQLERYAIQKYTFFKYF